MVTTKGYRLIILWMNSIIQETLAYLETDNKRFNRELFLDELIGKLKGEIR